MTFLEIANEFHSRGWRYEEKRYLWCDKREVLLLSASHPIEGELFQAQAPRQTIEQTRTNFLAQFLVNYP
jgi:hypothetical protein